MERLHPISLLLLFPVPASAQPVLDLSTNGTVPGDYFVYQAGPWIDPGAGGADLVWDFTGLGTDSVSNIHFVAPGGPDGALFPTATVAAQDGGSYAYSRFDASGGYFLGLSSGFVVIPYSDPMQMASFPATLGTTWVDDFAATYNVMGTTVTRNGTISAVADAYGTLQLPGGPLTNVLRVSATETYTENFEAGSGTYTNTYVDFLQAGTHYPIVHIYSITTDYFGNSSTITGAEWMNDVSTSIDHTAARWDDLRVRADDRTIVVTLPRTVDAGTVTLLSATGVVLEQRAVGAATAGGTLRFDARDPASGVYLVRLTSDSSMAVGRVVLE